MFVSKNECDLRRSNSNERISALWDMYIRLRDRHEALLDYLGLEEFVVKAERGIRKKKKKAG